MGKAIDHSSRLAELLATKTSGGRGIYNRGTGPDAEQRFLVDMLIKSGQSALGMVTKAGETVNIGSGLYQNVFDTGIHRFTPVFTPMYDAFASGRKVEGTAFKFKVLSGYNNPQIATNGLPEGARNALTTLSTYDVTGNIFVFGTDTATTYEAQEVDGSMGLDVMSEMTYATQVQNVLNLENALTYGLSGADSSTLSNSVPTGIAAPTNPAAANITGGALTASTAYNISIVPLSAEGMIAAVGSLVAPGTIAASNPNGYAVSTGKSITSADGADSWTVPGGYGLKTTIAKTTGASTPGISLTWDAMPNAAGYAIYWDTATNGILGAVVNTNAYQILAAPNGTQNVSALNFGTNQSLNPRIVNGVLSWAYAGGYVQHCGAAYTAAGAANTSTTVTPGGLATDAPSLVGDGAGNIKQFATAFQQIAFKYKVTITEIHCGARVMALINQTIKSQNVGGASTGIYMTTIPGQGGLTFSAGQFVDELLNPYSLDGIGQARVKIRYNPNIPDGMAFLMTPNLPPWYKNADTPRVAEVRPRRDWYQENWAVTNRRRGIGTYASLGFACYAPRCLGVIDNIN